MIFWRRQLRGRLVIDEEEAGEARSTGQQKSSNVNSNYFIGGLPEAISTLASANMEVRNNICTL